MTPFIDAVKLLAATINAHPVYAVIAIVTVCLLGSLLTIALLCSRDPSAAREVPGPILKGPARW